jgi:hypothetical protein
MGVLPHLRFPHQHYWREGHPFGALFTAARISLTVISLSPLASPLPHSAIEVAPRAMFTSVMIPSTVTLPRASQSPAQALIFQVLPPSVSRIFARQQEVERE